jgi:hypothetical protein
MHEQLQEIVDRVWKDRLPILAGPAVRINDTIQDRVYEYYASSDQIGQRDISSDIYRLLLEKLDWFARYHDFRYDDFQKGIFRHYKSNHAKSPSQGITRMYINAKPKYAGRVCIALLELCGVRPPGRPVSPYRDVVTEFKVAEGSEAFTSRRDKIVVYIKTLKPTSQRYRFDEGKALSQDLLKKCQPDWFTLASH